MITSVDLTRTQVGPIYPERLRALRYIGSKKVAQQMGLYGTKIAWTGAGSSTQPLDLVNQRSDLVGY
jgi:hypothetical protein